MSRLSLWWRYQCMAWHRLLRLPRKQVPVRIEDAPSLEHYAHPSELCRCAGVLVDPNTAAHAVDHKPDCPWLAAMCKACDGTGCCPTCHGDGCDPVVEREVRQ